MPDNTEFVILEWSESEHDESTEGRFGIIVIILLHGNKSVGTQIYTSENGLIYIVINKLK